MTTYNQSPSSTPQTVYLGLGSNLGDRQANLVTALGRLEAAVHITTWSSYYETEPVGYLDQPRFLNMACTGKTRLAPHALLTFVKDIEASMGRQASFRNAPRPIDIDILLYDDLHVATEELVIPHPRMHERAFVLVPLAEIAPDAIEPVGGKSIRELLAYVALEGVRRLNT